MRGWVFLSKREPHSQTLRGEPPLAQFVPFSDTRGGYTTRGLGSRGVGGIDSPILGSIAQVRRGRRGAGRGGDTP